MFVYVRHQHLECIGLVIFFLLILGDYSTFYEFEHLFEGHVVLEHVENESFLDSLTHGVVIEGFAISAVECVCGRLRRCCKGEVTDVTHLELACELNFCKFLVIEAFGLDLKLFYRAVSVFF